MAMIIRLMSARSESLLTMCRSALHLVVNAPIINAV